MCLSMVMAGAFTGTSTCEAISMLAISQAMGTDSAGEATAEERAASTATGAAPAASLPWPDVKPFGHSRLQSCETY